MPENVRRRLLRTSFFFWLTLLYIIAALVWWFISLNKQNDLMREYEIANIKNTVVEINNIEDAHDRNRKKYLGEGAIFLLFTMVGAAFVFSSVRKQFRLQQQQQNFMMAVTHELKTPIAIARLNLETMQKYSLDPEKQKKLIRTTLDETTRLNFLTNNILISSQLESQGYTFEAADASFELLLREEIDGKRAHFFTVENWETTVIRDENDSVSSKASVTITAGNEKIVAQGVGNGPVNAIDNALRSGLAKIYPELEKLELTDYKVRILEGRLGTGAVTRVLVETSDGVGEWSTIGVHENVIAASAMALEDAVTYGLLRQGRKPE